MDFIIRKETENDYRKVEETVRAAFDYPERIERGRIGCPYEHWMVNELRRRGGIAELSLLAIVGERIVGHIICSKAEVRHGSSVTEVLDLGPVSVSPEYQKKGVGKALINAVIREAKSLGHGAILFFGRPEYYPRFGFVDAEKFGISDSGGLNYPSFMGMELIEGYLSKAKGGRFFESDIYDDELNREAVKEFDKAFG